MRRTLSLAGTWQFQVDPDGSLTLPQLAPDREIQVPMPWQAVFPDLQQYSGYAWYRRPFDLSSDWLEGEALLHFGAVDYWCQVFINGELAGEHEGGYTPFTLPIGAFARTGSNDLAVHVYDVAQGEIVIERWPDFSPKQTQAQPNPPFDANEIPHGKQEWYINVGGIWQDVTLTAVPHVYINHVEITPDIHTGVAQIKVELAGKVTGSNATAINVAISDGETSVETSVPLTDDESSAYTIPLKVEQPRLWDTDSPNLYKATVSIQRGKSDPDGDDSVSVRFGFREIKAEAGKLLLNGQPLFLRCALDQDMYADTIYTVPSEEYLRDQFRKAKELGLNSLRCHIKPPDPIYLDLADEMGILVWTEIPSWRTFYVKGTQHKEQLDLGDTIKRRVEKTLVEMLRRDFNHPSIIIWTIVNEDWGTTLPLSGADREWVADMYDMAKQLDTTRLVVDNSACPHPWGPNIHVKSDIDDFHIYTNIPEQANSFERAIEQFNLRPIWTYSSFGDAERTGNEVLMLSEFGNWGLPSLRLLREPYGGKDPDWLKTGPWWNSWEGEAGWPAGAEERFRSLGLDAIWDDYEAFATATQWHQYAALKFEIEAMRRQPALMGYVVTELSDIYWESNGLLDFNRNPKAYHDVFRQINSASIISGRPSSYAYWQDHAANVRFFGSNYGKQSWPEARLRWSISGAEDGEGNTEEMEVRALAAGGVAMLGRQLLRLPQSGHSQIVSVTISLQADGEEIARNSLDLLAVPTSIRRTRYHRPVAVIADRHQVGTGLIPVLDRPPEGLNWSHPDDMSVYEHEEETGADASKLIGSMKDLGYDAIGRLTMDTEIAVSNHPNAQLLRWVREGGKLLFLSEGASPFFWVQGRGGTYGGSWLTAFSWLRPDVHKRLGGHNPLGLPFINVMPTTTILGLPVEDPAVQGDFLSGLISGWVGHPAIHTVQFQYGKGKVIMTTFRIADHLSDDPVAVALLHDLLDHLLSDDCQPVLKANY